MAGLLRAISWQRSFHDSPRGVATGGMLGARSYLLAPVLGHGNARGRRACVHHGDKSACHARQGRGVPMLNLLPPHPRPSSLALPPPSLILLPLLPRTLAPSLPPSHPRSLPSLAPSLPSFPPLLPHPTARSRGCRASSFPTTAAARRAAAFGRARAWLSGQARLIKVGLTYVRIG